MRYLTELLGFIIVLVFSFLSVHSLSLNKRSIEENSNTNEQKEFLVDENTEHVDFISPGFEERFNDLLFKKTSFQRCKSRILQNNNTTNIIDEFKFRNRHFISDQFDNENKNKINIGPKAFDQISKTIIEEVKGFSEDFDNFGLLPLYTGKFNPKDYLANKSFKTQLNESDDNKLSPYLFESKNIWNDHLPSSFALYDQNGNYEKFWTTVNKIKWMFDNRKNFNYSAQNFPLLEESVKILTSLKTGECLIKNMIDRTFCVDSENETVDKCYIDSLEKTLKELLLDCKFNIRSKEKETESVQKPLTFNEWTVLSKFFFDLCDHVKKDFHLRLKISYKVPYVESRNVDVISDMEVSGHYDILTKKFILSNLQPYFDYCENTQRLMKNRSEFLANSGDDKHIKDEEVKRYIININFTFSNMRKLYKIAKLGTEIIENLLITETIERPYEIENNIHSYFYHRKALIREFIFTKEAEFISQIYFNMLKFKREYESNKDKYTRYSLRKMKSKYIGEVFGTMREVSDLHEKYFPRLLMTDESYDKKMLEMCQHIIDNTIDEFVRTSTNNFANFYIYFIKIFKDFREVNLLSKRDAKHNLIIFCEKILIDLDD